MYNIYTLFPLSFDDRQVCPSSFNRLSIYIYTLYNKGKHSATVHIEFKLVHSSLCINVYVLERENNRRALGEIQSKRAFRLFKIYKEYILKIRLLLLIGALATCCCCCCVWSIIIGTLFIWLCAYHISLIWYFDSFDVVVVVDVVFARRSLRCAIGPTSSLGVAPADPPSSFERSAPPPPPTLPILLLLLGVVKKSRSRRAAQLQSARGWLIVQTAQLLARRLSFRDCWTLWALSCFIITSYLIKQRQLLRNVFSSHHLLRD